MQEPEETICIRSIKIDNNHGWKNSKNLKATKYEKCKYCGAHHRRGSNFCKAFGKTCYACKKKNHFSRMCWTSPGLGWQHFDSLPNIIETESMKETTSTETSKEIGLCKLFSENENSTCDKSENSIYSKKLDKPTKLYIRSLNFVNKEKKRYQLQVSKSWILQIW